MVGLGSKLKYLREKAGLSQAELGRQAGVNKSYICQMEHESKKTPSSDLLYRLSQTLGVTMEWFYKTPGYCNRCGVEMSGDIHYLTAEVPYVCGKCFEEGKGLLVARQKAMEEWIEAGKRRMGGEGR